LYQRFGGGAGGCHLRVQYVGKDVIDIAAPSRLRTKVMRTSTLSPVYAPKNLSVGPKNRHASDILQCLDPIMSLRNSKSLSVALLFSLSTLSIAANRAGADRVSEAVKAKALANYGKLPLSFEENRGQTDARVRFLSHGSGYSILLAPSEVVLNLQSAGQARHQSTIRIGFPGAKSSPVMAGDERQTAISSYFIGNDPAKWVTGAPNFARVHYRDLYPGIALAFYGNQGQLEYDFVVAPGADPRAIRLAFEGVDDMRIDAAGDLLVSTAAGQVRQHKPIVYQQSGSLRHMIDGRYVLQSHNRVAFEVGGYDARKPLIVDPVLSFATYLGSPGDEVGFGLSAAASQATLPAIAVDQEGNVYVTGFNGGSAATFTGHPATLTAAQGGGGFGVFVVKMNSTGALVYDVVFGGGLTDVGGGIATDSTGNAYITGFTGSPNFPITTGAPQTSNYGNASNPNAFVAKVNTTGTALLYSTYLGGTGSFWGRGIAVDHSGNAYVTGTASASGGTSFPLVNAISSTPSAGFLTEVNSAGTAFVYSTFLNPGIGYGVAVDSGGNAYVTGSTGTQSGPSPAQGYVLKVDANGSGIAYGPVLLGTAGQQTVGFGIALDAENDAYVTGMTSDPSFPQITSGAAQTKYGGGLTDGFALKLNSSGSLPPEYGTYIGGLGSSFIPERGSGIGVDTEGNAYVSGTTQCIGFPTASPISGARNGTSAVLMEGAVSGSSSNWSPTTLSGPFDQVNALAFNPTGTILYAGTSAVNAVGGGIYQSTNGGAWTLASGETAIDAIAVDPNTPDIIYAAGSGHLYQTTTGGTSWSQLPQTVGTSPVIAVAKTSPSTVYVGSSSSGLMYSTNAGSSWSTPTTAPPAGAIYALIVDPNNVATAYAGTASGVYRTTDGGAIWGAVNTGLPTVPGEPSMAVTVTSLAINSSTQTIYAVTGIGLYYTTNAGGNWTQAILGQIASTPLLVAVDNGNNVYVAFEGNGMATGTGGGTLQSDWSALTYNGLTQNQVEALAVPPGASGAYAGIVSATTAFLTQISPNGQSFLSSTCIGGSDNNLGQNIAVTPGGAVYVSGATYATNFPATPGALQTANAGLYDAFVVGIDVPPAEITSPAPGITLSGSLADFSWNAVGGATEYQLSVGTVPGGTNIFSGSTAGTSQTVGAIPCTDAGGGTIYVQLSAEVGGSFQPAADYTYKCKSGLGDFNGDGYQDVVWQNNSTRQVTVHYFDGAEGATDIGWNWLNESGEPSGWVLVGAGDFDGNGVPDLVWEYMPTGQVSVNYYGGPGGATYLGWNWLNEAGVPGWTVVAVADMNNDGVPDLIWQNNATNQVTVNYYGGTGGAVYQGWNWLNSAGEPAGWRVVAAADFDGNGTPDLVWQYTPTRQVSVNYYGGAGGATYQGWNWLNAAGVPGWTVVGASDFNGDGVPDLVWQNNATAQVTVNYYGGTGGATYIGWNWLSETGYPGWTALVPR
jgi:hypothetical protein